MPETPKTDEPGAAGAPIDWRPMEAFPDYGQQILLRVNGKIIEAACHGFDSSDEPEWRDWSGANRLYVQPDAWAYPASAAA
jgi:hypothetical protein